MTKQDQKEWATLLKILGPLTAALIAIAGWLIGMSHRIASIDGSRFTDKDAARLETYIAENYVRQHRAERIERKLDRLEDQMRDSCQTVNGQ